jgi:hypothetical protein
VRMAVLPERLPRIASGLDDRAGPRHSARQPWWADGFESAHLSRREVPGAAARSFSAEVTKP